MCIVLDFPNTVLMDLNSTQPMEVSTFLCIVFSCRPYYGCIHHHFRILSKLKMTILVKQAMKIWSGLIWLIISAKQLQITKNRNCLCYCCHNCTIVGATKKVLGCNFVTFIMVCTWNQLMTRIGLMMTRQLTCIWVIPRCELGFLYLRGCLFLHPLSLQCSTLK